MRNYDLTVVLRAVDGNDKILDRIKKLVTDNGGKVLGVDEWGKRELSYPIKKETQGVYYNLALELDAKVVKPVGEKVRIDEEVLRHLLVRKE